MNPSNPHTSYAPLLQSARQLHGSQDHIEAEKAAVQAIGHMAICMSANNPKLADAYLLHTEICMQLAMTDPAKQLQWLDKAAVSQKHRVEVLELGMANAALMEAKGSLGAILINADKFEEAVGVLTATRALIADQLDTGEAGVSISHYLSVSYLLAEALVELSRAGEGATTLATCFNKLRGEHFRDAAVMKDVTMVSALLAACLEEEEAAESLRA